MTGEVLTVADLAARLGVAGWVVAKAVRRHGVAPAGRCRRLPAYRLSTVRALLGIKGDAGVEKPATAAEPEPDGEGAGDATGADVPPAADDAGVGAADGSGPPGRVDGASEPVPGGGGAAGERAAGVRQRQSGDAVAPGAVTTARARTAAALDAAIAERMAALPKWWATDAQKNGLRRPRPARTDTGAVGMVTPRLEDLDLDESTAPAAIAAGHAREVRDYFAAHPDATVEEASEELVLCVWIVERWSGRARAPVPPKVRSKRTADEKDRFYRVVRAGGRA